MTFISRSLFSILLNTEELSMRKWLNVLCVSEVLVINLSGLQSSSSDNWLVQEDLSLKRQKKHTDVYIK